MHLKTVWRCRVGVEFSKVEVRFEDLTVETEVYVGTRALPTVTNVFRNVAESGLLKAGLIRSARRKFTILKGVSGVLKPVPLLTLTSHCTAASCHAVQFAGKGLNRAC